MKKTKYLVRPLALAAAVVLGGSLSTRATITLTLQDATSKAETGFTTAGSAGANLVGNDLVGLYRFNNSGNEGPSNPFWSACLSPSGLLDWNSHDYTALSFVAGSTGHNPASWSTAGLGDSGIQNAQYLWRQFSPGIIAGGTADQGAGLALAMLEALYDSTGYGTYNTANSGTFYVTAGLSGNVLSAYNSYLAALNPGAVSANLGNGYILRDSLYVSSGGTQTTPGAGQDMIWNLTPVPEPTTMIAGALLLLPFGASTIRFMRKNRKA